MKNFALTLILALFTLSLFAQEADTVKKEVVATDVKVVTTTDGKTYQTTGDNVFEVKDAKDTTRIKIGKKTISIIEDPSGTSVKVSDATEPVTVESEGEENTDEAAAEEDKDDDKDKDSKMDGHWSGFYWGVNNFLTKDFSMVLPSDAAFMDLNTGRSWNINLNFLEHSFGFGTDRIGLVTGMGFGFNNYHFDGNNNVQDSAGRTRELRYGEKLDKSKLSSTYLNVPLLLEFQFPGADKDDRAYISVGVIGGVKIGSHSKVLYKGQKDKVKDDFNLSPLRYAFTARVGYKDLSIYGNYYPVQLFESGKGPELYPFDLGLALTF